MILLKTALLGFEFLFLLCVKKTWKRGGEGIFLNVKLGGVWRTGVFEQSIYTRGRVEREGVLMSPSAIFLFSPRGSNPHTSCSSYWDVFPYRLSVCLPPIVFFFFEGWIRITLLF